jgi:DNA-binding transcriptional LysR family regulator
MRLRHIEVFHTVMQAGSISGAAQLLAISQPAVTKVLLRCESQLGLPLFERTRGRLYPTPEAQKLFVEVDRLHRELLTVRRLAANLKDQPAPTVRLVSIPTLGTAVVPTALTRWRGKYAAVRCKLSTHHDSEIVTALVLGEADLALSLHDPKNPSISAQPLMQGVMTAIAPRGTWPETATGQPLPIKELPANLIGLAEDDPLGAQVADAADAHGVSLEAQTLVQTYHFARALVENGSGVAVVDPFTAAQIDTNLAQHRPLDPQIPVKLYLLTANAAPLSQSTRYLVKCIKDEAARCLEFRRSTAPALIPKRRIKKPAGP